MNPITADEIKMAEKLLLPEGATFGEADSERVKVIQEIDNSCDIVACPGSGKTTVLLAKLLILANRMPFEDNRGICVLTHTNVAIDEIKKKAGMAGDKLFNYPNFFGTFQKFVDKYLAKPAYYLKFNNQFQFIDNDRAKTKISIAYFEEFKKNYKITNCIYYFVKNKFPKSYPKNQQTKIQNKIRLKFINDIVFDFQKENVFYKTDLSESKIFAKDDNTDRYKFIHSLKYPVISEGFLFYADAFSLGKWYVEEHIDKLKKSFSQRFKYVFVDEMQDTDSHQLKIIEELFKKTDTIIQYFGDPNQSIYDFSVKKEHVWESGKNSRKILKISDSKRFGSEIACVLDKIKIDGSITLSSNSENNTLKPHLVVYKRGKENEILEKFTELIYNNKHIWQEDLKGKEPVFKAIGWVGKERIKEEIKGGKLNISSYFPGFEKKSTKNKQVYENLKFYLCKDNEAVKEKGAKIYYDSIINAFLEILDRGGVKREVVVHKQIDGKIQQITQERSYTKTSFFEVLENKGKLKCLLNKIAYWSNEIYNFPENYNSKVIENVRRYIKKYLPKIFGEINKNKVNEFINEPPENLRGNSLDSNENKGHIFKSKNPKYEDIPIEVGTVHTVKGETHTATLFMETSYQATKGILGHESERVFDFILNKKNCLLEKRTYHKETIKMVHVGFSRPTHLLCFAVCEDRLNKEEINGNEWDIIDV